MIVRSGSERSCEAIVGELGQLGVRALELARSLLEAAARVAQRADIAPHGYRTDRPGVLAAQRRDVHLVAAVRAVDLELALIAVERAAHVRRDEARRTRPAGLAERPADELLAAQALLRHVAALHQQQPLVGVVQRDDDVRQVGDDRVVAGVRELEREQRRVAVADVAHDARERALVAALPPAERRLHGELLAAAAHAEHLDRAAQERRLAGLQKVLERVPTSPCGSAPAAGS